MLEKITDVICIEKRKQNILAGDFNRDFNRQEDFTKALRVEGLEVND